MTCRLKAGLAGSSQPELVLSMKTVSGARYSLLPFSLQLPRVWHYNRVGVFTRRPPRYSICETLRKFRPGFSPVTHDVLFLTELFVLSWSQSKRRQVLQSYRKRPTGKTHPQGPQTRLGDQR